ncbi:MAG: DUF116 domain-containing protein [Chitinivibrionales bacterium]|nr:DUF116 domain-containing protein [Chitinivibrionales bacterium]MBD3357788.1 DUF116 domain-containing protein [Chitinivibrionales bacterium]
MLLYLRYAVCHQSYTFNSRDPIMEPITYDLTAKEDGSDTFYATLHCFSREVMERIDKDARELLTEYVSFVERDLQEPPRSREEYAVELLTLAMTWRRYLGASQRAPIFSVSLLQVLIRLRRRGSLIKKMVDPLRGRLAGAFLVPHIGSAPLNSRYDCATLGNLIAWLDATGEFKHEVKRFRRWHRFFASREAGFMRRRMDVAIGLFSWFQNRAHGVLGRFTPNVNRFLTTFHPHYRYREDEIFCGKEDVEYHINMVGSEVMNWGFAYEYGGTSKRVVLLPACMRARPEGECKANMDELDITCVGCTEGCNINRVKQQGRELGFEVYIVPHTSGFTRWLKRWQDRPDCGVVAVACLLNIVVGGYEMRELRIPSQCVPLDRCGCKKHWHGTGIATDLNRNRLAEVITRKRGVKGDMLTG